MSSSHFLPSSAAKDEGVATKSLSSSFLFECKTPFPPSFTLLLFFCWRSLWLLSLRLSTGADLFDLNEFILEEWPSMVDDDDSFWYFGFNFSLWNRSGLTKGDGVDGVRRLSHIKTEVLFNKLLVLASPKAESLQLMTGGGWLNAAAADGEATGWFEMDPPNLENEQLLWLWFKLPLFVNCLKKIHHTLVYRFCSRLPRTYAGVDRNSLAARTTLSWPPISPSSPARPDREPLRRLEWCLPLSRPLRRLKGLRHPE